MEEEEKSIKKTRESTPFHYQPPLSTPTIEVRLSQSVSSTWKALRPCGTPSQLRGVVEIHTAYVLGIP